MARIDRLRATGLDDADALRLTAPAFDDERARAVPGLHATGGRCGWAATTAGCASAPTCASTGTRAS